MIRPFTLLCFGAFAVAGAWLYQVKHQVALKDRELVEIRRQTEQVCDQVVFLLIGDNAVNTLHTGGCGRLGGDPAACGDDIPTSQALCPPDGGA